MDITLKITGLEPAVEALNKLTALFGAQNVKQIASTVPGKAPLVEEAAAGNAAAQKAIETAGAAPAAAKKTTKAKPAAAEAPAASAVTRKVMTDAIMAVAAQVGREQALAIIQKHSGGKAKISEIPDGAIAIAEAEATTTLAHFLAAQNATEPAADGDLF